MAKEQTTEKKYYKKTTKKTTFNQYNLTFCDTSTGEILKQTEENLQDGQYRMKYIVNSNSEESQEEFGYVYVTLVIPK